MWRATRDTESWTDAELRGYVLSASSDLAGRLYPNRSYLYRIGFYARLKCSSCRITHGCPWGVLRRAQDERFLNDIYGT
jgi:hypothetical protein